MVVYFKNIVYSFKYFQVNLDLNSLYVDYGILMTM